MDKVVRVGWWGVKKDWWGVKKTGGYDERTVGVGIAAAESPKLNASHCLWSLAQHQTLLLSFFVLPKTEMCRLRIAPSRQSWGGQSWHSPARHCQNCPFFWKLTKWERFWIYASDEQYLCHRPLAYHVFPKVSTICYVNDAKLNSTGLPIYFPVGWGHYYN